MSWDTRYAHPWAIDRRHMLMLKAVCDLCKPRTVLEIGSFRGASLFAFLSAERVIACDPKPQRELVDMVGQHSNLRLLPCRSDDDAARAMRPDMVFIDGDHGDAAVADYKHFLSIGTPIVAMHDVFGSIPVQPWGRGSAQAGRMMRGDPAWRLVLGDHKVREGEATERGLMVGFRELPQQCPALFETWDRLEAMSLQAIEQENTQAQPPQVG